MIFRKRIRPTLTADFLEAWGVSEANANRLGLPREWLTCPMCGEQSWRWPPHSFDPCPLVVKMTEAAGLKMDAERMTAARAGIQVETLTKLVREHFLEEGGDEE